MSALPPAGDASGPMLPPASTDDTAGLSAADVMHGEVESLPPSLTVGELRDWFAVSASRRLAVVAAGTSYVAAFTPSDIPPETAADRPALDFAREHPTVTPDATAAGARDLVVATGARRLPVVDAHGDLHGVVAATTDLQFFACRPQPAPD